MSELEEAVMKNDFDYVKAIVLFGLEDIKSPDCLALDIAIMLNRTDIVLYLTYEGAHIEEINSYYKQLSTYKKLLFICDYEYQRHDLLYDINLINLIFSFVQ